MINQENLEPLTNVQLLYESIINSSEDAIISKTLNGIITSWNRSAVNLFGYLPQEVIGKHISIIIPPNLLNEEVEIIEKIKNGNYIRHYETIRLRKDKTSAYISLSVSPIKDAEGNIIGASKIARDITLKIETEKKLSASLKEVSDYKYALEESSIVAITDQKGIIKYANDNFCKISKYSVDELVGQDHRIINSGYHPKEYIRDLWITIANGKIWKGELKNKAKDGTVYWVNTTIVPFLNEEGKPYQYVAIRDDITERKKVEEEILQLNIELDIKVLERTKELLQTKNELTDTLERVSFLAGIANSIQDPIISTNAKGVITRWNDAAEKLYEWKSEEVIGKTVQEILNPIYLNESRDEIFEVLKTEPLWQGEIIFHNKSHKQINLLITGSLLKDAKENIVGVLTVGRDITKRKKAEEALSKLNNELEQRVKERTEDVYNSEKKYRHLFENNPLPMLAMDLKTFRFLDVNKMALEQYGYTREEFLLMTAVDLRPESDIDEFKKIDFTYNDTQSNHNKGIWNHRKKDGTIIQVEIITHDILFEGTEARLILANDVTEKKRIEEKLIASEKQFRHTLDNMLEGAQIIGFDWRYIYVNDSMAKHGKYSKSELIGYTVMEKYPGIEDTKIFKIYKKCLNERISIHLENEFVFPDKTTGWFELSFQPVPEGIFILSVDITSRKQAEAEIAVLNETLEKKVVERTEQLEVANRELDSFSYSVSHDLRAPLRAINGYSRILIEDFGTVLEPEANRILNNIVNNVTKMGHLIDDLLSFSRLGRKELALTKISTQDMVVAICNETVSEHLDKNIEFNIHKLKPINGDIASIKQVWVNLISNAVKYSQRNQKTIIEIGCIAKKQEVTYYIKDNGAGFDMRYADKLFGVFQRLHSEKEFEGTGVGLAIVHRIITKHNGKVWAKSTLNEGATFYFTLKKQNEKQRN